MDDDFMVILTGVSFTLYGIAINSVFVYIIGIFFLILFFYFEALEKELDIELDRLKKEASVLGIILKDEEEFAVDKENRSITTLEGVND